MQAEGREVRWEQSQKEIKNDRPRLIATDVGGR
jgi:hypothetical protein